VPSLLGFCPEKKKTRKVDGLSSVAKGSMESSTVSKGKDGNNSNVRHDLLTKGSKARSPSSDSLSERHVKERIKGKMERFG
jgi:hypothetical protein